jgi:hypothetical protein
MSTIAFRIYYCVWLVHAAAAGVKAMVYKASSPDEEALVKARLPSLLVVSYYHHVVPCAGRGRLWRCVDVSGR